MTEYVINLEELPDRGPAEIIVDLPYLPQVEDALDRLEVRIRQDSVKTDETLDLALITIEDVKASAGLIVENNKVQLSGKFAPLAPPRLNLDVCIIALRQDFQYSADGWSPEIGKNRTMNGVHGAPHIGGSGYPRATDEPTLAAIDTGKEVRVGLIDTKFYPCEQFGKRVIALDDSRFEPSFPFTQRSGHATFTIGRILEAAPGATVIAKAVLTDELAVAKVWDVATAMAEFIHHDVSVLVLPLVCFTADGAAPMALQRAVDILRTDMVVAAAAGNHGDAKPENGQDVNQLPAFPAACAGAIAVGAVGTAANGFAPAPFSPNLPWVQIVAPGDDVTSVFVRGHVDYLPAGDLELPKDDGEFYGGAIWSGTSFAAATFGGAIADAVRKGEGSAVQVAAKMLMQKPPENRGIGAPPD